MYAIYAYIGVVPGGSMGRQSSGSPRQVVFGYYSSSTDHLEMIGSNKSSKRRLKHVESHQPDHVQIKGVLPSPQVENTLKDSASKGPWHVDTWSTLGQ